MWFEFFCFLSAHAILRMDYIFRDKQEFVEMWIC